MSNIYGYIRVSAIIRLDGDGGKGESCGSWNSRK